MHQFVVSCGMQRFLMKMEVEKGDTSRRAHLILKFVPVRLYKGCCKVLEGLCTESTHLNR